MYSFVFILLEKVKHGQRSCYALLNYHQKISFSSKIPGTYKRTISNKEKQTVHE